MYFGQNKFCLDQCVYYLALASQLTADIYAPLLQCVDISECQTFCFDHLDAFVTD